MKKKLYLFLLTFFPFLLFCDVSSDYIYEGKIVHSITIESEGKRNFDQISIESQLSTKVGDHFNHKTFDEDLKKLAKDHKGVWHNFKINNDELDITIKLFPKPILKSIHIAGSQKDYKLSERKIKDAIAEGGFEIGQEYDQEMIAKAVLAIKETYINHGYSNVQVVTKESDQYGQGTIEFIITPGKKGFIHEIEINGIEDPILKRKLRDVMQTKTKSILTPITGAGKVDQALIDQDHLLILHFLQSRGYLDVKVQIYITDLDETKRKIIVDVELGERYYFGQIRIEGNITVPKEEILALIQPEIETGKPYSQESLARMSNAIQQLHGSKGRIETTVSYTYEYNFQTNQIDILFEINESEAFKVGRIIVRGNSTTETRVILNQCDLVPGETYNSTQLLVTQQKLQSLNYFKTVNVYAVKEPSKLGTDYRDVIIEIEEQATGNAQLFFGFSSSDQIFGGLDVTENNFNHKGLWNWWRQGISKIRGGGEYLHLKAQIGTLTSSYTIAWQNPNYNDSNWRVGFDVTYGSSQVQSKDYTIDSVVFQVFASYPLARYTNIGMKARIRDGFTRVKPDSPTVVEEQRNNNGLVGGAGPNINYDSTDNAFRPHRGIRVNLDVELDGVHRHVYNPKEFPMFRISSTNSAYIPIGRRTTLKLKTDYKVLLPFGRGEPQMVPLSERFFLGGDGSVRGIQPAAIGPKFPKNDGAAVGFAGQALYPDDENTDNPTGGVTSFATTIELAFKVAKPIDIFFFIDGGSISLYRWKIQDYVITGGFGTRLDVGRMLPIMVGYGVPFNSPANVKDIEQSVFFSMGGQF